MKLSDFEIFRKMEYVPFENNGRKYFISNYPYLDIVFNDNCNARCQFCIARLVHSKVKANVQAHKPKIKFAIEKLGVKEVLLLGGEPTINDDIFDTIEYLKQFNLNKICTTTNGHRISKDPVYAAKFISSGITHINLSLMTLDEAKQKEINGTKTYVSIDHLRSMKELCDQHGVKLRVNNNVFKGNNETKEQLISFYDQVKDHCHSIKFSPLLKTDTFSTINVVSEFNRTHILSDDGYDDLWHSVENHFCDYPIVRNNLTFGFVEYSMIVLPTPIIFNYNQHGQLRKKIIEEQKINNLKLLPTGDLSLSWNREEKEFFIKTD